MPPSYSIRHVRKVQLPRTVRYTRGLRTLVQWKYLFEGLRGRPGPTLHRPSPLRFVLLAAPKCANTGALQSARYSDRTRVGDHEGGEAGTAEPEKNFNKPRYTKSDNDELYWYSGKQQTDPVRRVRSF